MNRRYYLLLLPCILLLLCTGCGIYLEYLTVTFPALPEGQQVVILLHPPEGWVDEAAERPETEIGQYCEDGWMAAEYGPVMPENRHFINRVNGLQSRVQASISEEGGWWLGEYSWFCGKYGSFRCALVDAEGNILRISGECSLLPEKHFSVPDTVQLDTETMTLKPVHWLPVGLHGHRLTYYARWAGFFAQFCTVFLVRLFAAKHMKKVRRRILIALCLIPLVLYFGIFLAISLVPPLRQTASFELASLTEPLIGLAFMLMLAVSEMNRIDRKKRREQEAAQEDT